MHAKVTEFANLLHYEFVGTRDPASLSNRLFLAEAGKNFSYKTQKWHLQKSASDDGVKIELRPVLAQFKANLSFPTPGMLLSGL